MFSTIDLLAEKNYTLRAININAKDSSGKTARQRLQTVEPSAELLKAFTAMIAAVDSAKEIEQAKGALAMHSETNQDVFKDAIEYQADDSPTSSCPTTDNERLSAKARHKGKARLTKPLKQIGRNWASKYKHAFRSTDHHLDGASASEAILITSWLNE